MRRVLTEESARQRCVRLILYRPDYRRPWTRRSVGCCATTRTTRGRRWHRAYDGTAGEVRPAARRPGCPGIRVNYSPIGAHRTERRGIKLQDTYNAFNGPGPLTISRKPGACATPLGAPRHRSLRVGPPMVFLSFFLLCHRRALPTERRVFLVSFSFNGPSAAFAQHGTRPTFSCPAIVPSLVNSSR